MRNLLFLPILLILFSSCSQKLVPLTDSLRKEYELTDEVMPILQYYVSKDVVFTGGTSSTERDIKKGVIYDTKGKKVDEIIIYEKTPGICLNVHASSLEISFDRRESALTFGVYPDYVKGLDGKVIKKDNPNYRLQADFWGAVSGEFLLGEKPMHTPASNRYAHLLVDLRKVAKIEKEPRVARGEKVRS
jgi:hypothetical protein